MSPNTLLLIQAAILIVGPWLLWNLPGVRAVTPLAVLQIVTGVLLGPSVLGHLAPALQGALFPAASIPRIGAVAQLGVVFFSFVTGMHLDLDELRASRQLGITATGSFLLPVVAGLALAAPLAVAFPAVLPQSGATAGYTAALALLMTVTALPVLAALLQEMRLLHTPFGQRAVGLAAINDSAMWLGVAAILLVVAPGTEGSAVAWLPVYAALLVAVGWLLRRFGSEPRLPAVLVLMAAFVPLSSAFAENVGLGYVIGAFLAGTVVPAPLRRPLIAQLEWPSLYILMPFFFMATGLRVDVDLLSPALLGLVLILTGTAIVSKIGGTALAARAAGDSWRSGLALGTAVQTKGLMEVLVATILVDHRVIGEALFAPLILMALICTTATAPLLRLLGVGRAAAVA